MKKKKIIVLSLLFILSIQFSAQLAPESSRIPGKTGLSNILICCDVVIENLYAFDWFR